MAPPPPPRRRALPLPRGAADARGVRLPCGACGELLSVPVGLSRCACPLCGAELAVDSAQLRDYILSSAAAAFVPLAAPSASPALVAREARLGRPSFAIHAGLPQDEPVDRLVPLEWTQIKRPIRLNHVHQDEQVYPDHMIDEEEVYVVNETDASNTLQRNRFSLGRGIVGTKTKQFSPLNVVRPQVHDQHSSYNIQPKQAQLAHLHRVIHSEEMQEGSHSHEVYREERHTELIYETAATNRNQRVGCSVGPEILSVAKRHIGAPNQIIQQLHKHPYQEIHAEGTQVGCLDGVIHAQEVQPEPVNQANNGEEASIEIINKTIARERNWQDGCSVGPNSFSAKKRKALTTDQVTHQLQKQQPAATHAEHARLEHPDQAICEPIGHTTQREAMCCLPIKDTTARCSKQKISQLANAKAVVKKRHTEPLNHIIQQAERQPSDIDCHGIMHGNPKTGAELYSTLTLKEQEQVLPLNKLTDVKKKHVRTNDQIQKEQIEIKDCKQTSGQTQRKNTKGLMASSNAGVQLRRSKRLAKDSVAVVGSDPVELQVFSQNDQVPAGPMDSEPIERVPVQQRSASPNCEVSAAMTDTESVESEHDEQCAASADQSMYQSDPPDIDRIITDFYPSTSSVREMPQEISDEPADPDLTATPSNTDMSDPEHFARHYCLLFPLEVRRALAKKKSNSLLDRLVSEGSDEASLHDLTDSEEYQQGMKGKKVGRGPTLCVRVWTLPEGVRVPVSLNTSGLPIGKNAAMLGNFLGTLARDGMLAPLTCENWKSIPKENKNVMWHIVKLKFDVVPPCELSVLKCIRKKWRGWRSNLKRKHYDSHITEEERLSDRDPRVLKKQWPLLVAYWNTEKAKAASARCKASRARSTYINNTGSKSFARILQEKSRSHDTALENPEGSGSEDASAMGAERRVSTHSYEPGACPKDLQERSARQAARAKRKAGDEASTLRKEVVVMEENRPEDLKEWAVKEASRAKQRAEDEASTLRKKLIEMEESQKKLQEDLTRMTNTVSAMQKVMSTGGFPNGLFGEPTVPPGF